MKATHHLRVCAVTFMVYLIVFAGTASPAERRANDSKAAKPNIVFILADDLGWADLAAYGHPFHQTPTLDGLARQGMRFTQAYAAAPVCAPSRAAILTGQAPARLHLTGQPSFFNDPPIRKFLHPKFRTTLPPQSLPTVTMRLKSAGYATALFGKFGVEGDPRAYGFDEFGDGQINDLIERATGFLHRHRRRSFFLQLSFNEVHVPLEPKADPALVAKYRKLLSADAPGGV